MKQIRIQANTDKGFSWYHSDNIWVKGSFFDENDNFYEHDNLPEYFKQLTDYNSFVELIKKSNGIFTVVINKGDEFWCANDRSGTFPLFYYDVNGEWVVTDDFKTINKERNFNYNNFQLNLFKSLGHTFGCETLISNVFQLQCAQVLKLQSNKQKEAEFYHSFSVNKFNVKPETLLLKEGVKVFERSFKRLVKSLNGRTAVVPLSGGYDSRMIVAGLKKHGYKDVICFTYGKRENNKELVLSEKVAHQLGYKWIFVEYNSSLIEGYAETQEFQEYMHYMSHLGSMFYLQEYFAVKYLSDNKLVPDDSVFLPGHSGDLIGGSQLVKVFDKEIRFNEIPDRFLSKKINLAPLNTKDKERLKNLVQNEISAAFSNNAATVFEELDIREKISKVIFNSSLVFDYFNYEKRFPFWDNDILNFFLSIPLEQREMKKLYDTILVQYYFTPLNINYSRELQPVKKQIVIQSIKNRIKKYLPITVRHKLLRKTDWKNYYEATQPLLNEMVKGDYTFKFQGKSYNEILVGYYLFSLTQKKDSIQELM
jgi:asparagine synthase (glutamine-hydrolysing)